MYNTSIPSVSSSGEHVSTEDCCMYSEQGYPPVRYPRTPVSGSSLSMYK